MSRTAAGALAVACMCAGCAGPAEQIESVASRIVYGEVSPPGIEDAVLMLRTTIDGVELLCSATLVAPNLVVTARHCVAHLDEGLFRCTVKGELVDNPEGGGRLGLDLPADTLELYDGSTPRGEPIARGQSLHSTLSDNVCLNDVAFLVLDRALSIAPLTMRLDRRTRVGETTALVGYGADEKQVLIDYRTQVRRRKGRLIIRDVGPDSIVDGVTTTAPRTIIVKGPSGCVGDSGGPLLSESTHALVGVYSLSDGDTCTDEAQRQEFVSIRPFSQLVAEAFGTAGSDPLREPPETGTEEQDASAEAGNSEGTVEDAGEKASDAAPKERGPSSFRSDTGCTLARGRPGPAGLLFLIAAVAHLRRRALARISAGRRVDRPRPRQVPWRRAARSGAEASP